jgi:hypothetical protein
MKTTATEIQVTASAWTSTFRGSGRGRPMQTIQVVEFSADVNGVTYSVRAQRSDVLDFGNENAWNDVTDGHHYIVLGGVEYKSQSMGGLPAPVAQALNNAARSTGEWLRSLDA